MYLRVISLMIEEFVWMSLTGPPRVGSGPGKTKQFSNPIPSMYWGQKFAQSGAHSWGGGSHGLRLQGCPPLPSHWGGAMPLLAAGQEGGAGLVPTVPPAVWGHDVCGAVQGGLLGGSAGPGGRGGARGEEIGWLQNRWHWPLQSLSFWLPGPNALDQLFSLPPISSLALLSAQEVVKQEPVSVGLLVALYLWHLKIIRPDIDLSKLVGSFWFWWSIYF